MKRLEDLRHGDTFSLKDSYYILTSDYRIKKNYELHCINLATGYATWIDSASVVNPTPIYVLDDDNNNIPIKYAEKDV